MPTIHANGNMATLNEFDKVLLDAIDAAFFSLGECVKQSFYNFLESNYEIDHEDIPGNLKMFQSALEKIF
jgi:hypothetical protein